MDADLLLRRRETERFVHPDREIEGEPGLGRELLEERDLLAVEAAGVVDAATLARVEHAGHGDELHAGGRFLGVGPDVDRLPRSNEC